jgi:hypothetical protein
VRNRHSVALLSGTKDAIDREDQCSVELRKLTSTLEPGWWMDTNIEKYRYKVRVDRKYYGEYEGEMMCCREEQRSIAV